MCSPAAAWPQDIRRLGQERSTQPIRESRDALLRPDIGAFGLRYGFGTCSDRPPTAQNVRRMLNVLLICVSQGAAVYGAVPKDLVCRKVPDVVLIITYRYGTLRLCPWQPGAAPATIPVDHG